MTSLEFAEAVRCLSAAARRAGYRAPAFRSRPQGTARRTIRRRADGSATVAVALRNRPQPAVLADLVDGVIAANRLVGAPAGELRDQLWSSLSGILVAHPVHPTGSPVDAAGQARPPLASVVSIAA